MNYSQTITDQQYSIDEIIADAIQRSKDHANPEWFETALSIVENVSKSNPEFTIDQIWKELEGRSVETHDASAMGAVMKEAAKRGLIVNTKTMRPSERKSTHGRYIFIWKSLLI